ncbi:hypothetical protein GCM10028820_15550 [Tessaracoccus terricola]
MSGAFIVLEGGDGVGKSTQVDALVEWLAARGVRHVRTRQPGGTELGAKLRSLVLDPATGDVAPRAEALIYAADKAQHLMQVVEPALADGAVVVCDRYVDSMIAYQGAGRVLDVAEVEEVARWATHGLRPDLTILLDTEPGDAVGRIAEKDRLEGAGDEFHRRVRAHFLHLSEQDPERYLVVDARLPIPEVTAAITARLGTLLDCG